MEVIGTQFKPTTALDPMGAAKAGMELGNLGLQPLRIAQELRSAQIEERQKLIAEQEAQRALDLKRKEDSAKSAVAGFLRKHTKKDEKTGKMITDRDAAYQEALMTEGLDPGTLQALERGALENRAASIKNATDLMAEFERQKVEAARVMRGMQSEEQAARYLESKLQNFSKMHGVSRDLLNPLVADYFGMTRPGASLRENAKARVESIDISEQQERSNIAMGVGRADVDPNSSKSKAFRDFMAGQGRPVSEDISYASAVKDPTLMPFVEAFNKKVTGSVAGEGTRAEESRIAAEAKAQRVVFEDALSLAQANSAVITRPGTTVVELFRKYITQPEKQGRIKAAIDAYNVRNPNAQLRLEDGTEQVFARLRQENEKLKGIQAGAASIAATGDIAGEAGRKIPSDVQRERNAEQARIIREEYEANVERAKNARDPAARRSAGADVDAAARELKKLGVTVPGWSDVQRGAKPSTTRPPAPAGRVYVRDKTTSAVGHMDAEKAKRAIASGRFERAQ